MAASEVCKYWRNVSSPVIADTVRVKIDGFGWPMDKLSRLSIGYKHLVFWVRIMNFLNIFFKLGFSIYSEWYSRISYDSGLTTFRVLENLIEIKH